MCSVICQIIDSANIGIYVLIELIVGARTFILIDCSANELEHLSTKIRTASVGVCVHEAAKWERRSERSKES